MFEDFFFLLEKQRSSRINTIDSNLKNQKFDVFKGGGALPARNKANIFFCARRCYWTQLKRDHKLRRNCAFLFILSVVLTDHYFYAHATLCPLSHCSNSVYLNKTEHVGEVSLEGFLPERQLKHCLTLSNGVFLN